LVCNVFLVSDLAVVSGVNAGEAVDGAENSFVGDVYRFSPIATSHDLVVNDDDAGFEDNVLDQTIGDGSEVGTVGDPIEMESRLVFMGSDGSTVDVLLMNNTTSSGTGEYFLPQSPLVPGMDYTLIRADADPGEVKYQDIACVCFGRGSMIRMADGTEKPVEALVEGDMVLTRDNGAQPVRWVGGRTVAAFGHLAPIVIQSGALGNKADLIVSPQHRMLIADWRAEVMLGTHEVLVKARDLTNSDTIYRREGGVVEYFHILFDTHEIIYAEGIPSESLHINRKTLDSLAEDSRAEIIELFPDIVETPQISALASRMSLKSYEASALLKQVGFR